MHQLRLLFSVIILAALSCSPLREYRELPEVKSWEPEIEKFSGLSKTEKYPGDAIIFAGSSSIRLWSTLAEDMAPFSVIQRGYGGARLTDFAVYAERIFDPLPGRALVLFIANDITGGEKDKSPEEVKKLFLNVVNSFRKSHPRAPVFWIAITPSRSRWNAWSKISEANNLIKETCKNGRDLHFISTEHAFLNEKGEPREELFRPDKLHLNSEGYNVWTDIIKGELNRILKEVKLIAHRGASYEAPENTVASAALAWEKGADAVEVDIYLSKDNKIICSHDANTRRTTGQDHKISETDSEVLRTLDAGSFKDKKYAGEKLPFLDEIIRTVPRGKELVVEIKCGSEVLPYLKEAITKYEKNITFTFISFSFETISDTKKIFPGNPCYWLCSNAGLLEKTIVNVAPAGLDGVSLAWSIINENVIRKAEDLDLEVYSWTVDDPAEAKRLFSLGVKGITTNRPGWLNEQIF